MSPDCGKTAITMRKTPFRTAGMRFPHIRKGCVIVRKRLFRIPEKALPRGGKSQTTRQKRLTRCMTRGYRNRPKLAYLRQNTRMPATTALSRS